MQYLIIAYDKKDVLNKRLEVRDEHVKGAREFMKKGAILNAGAFIEDEKMVGSTLFVDFPSREELDKWLENEPYVKNGVWDMEKIQILPIKVLPSE